MLNSLNWPTLQRRREQAKAIMMYRIVNGLVAIPASQHLVPALSRTRGHDLRFLQPYNRVQAYKQSFFPPAIRIWNSAIRRHKQTYSKWLRSWSVYRRARDVEDQQFLVDFNLHSCTILWLALFDTQMHLCTEVREYSIIFRDALHS